MQPAEDPAGPARWLAALIGGTTRSAFRARSILDRRDLVDLSRRGQGELALEFGLDPGAAGRIVAAFALGRALEQARRPARPSLRSARAVFELLRGRFSGLEQECFLTLVLDGRHRLRRVVPVSAGTLTSSLVHPREVFRGAVREAAAAVIVAHNHPSGDPEPSREDLETTSRLRQAGELLGIPLCDHVIIGEDGYVSLRERLGF